MKALQCEMCGSQDIVKQDGYFVCQHCGTKYSVEEARKMMIEGTVDVSGSTIKVDTSDELANLHQLAERARSNRNSEDAKKYYDMILVKDPSDWEAYFYSVYYKVHESKNAEILSSAGLYIRTLSTTFDLIIDNVKDEKEQIKAVKEVAKSTDTISSLLYMAATRVNSTSNATLQLMETIEILYKCGDLIEQKFDKHKELTEVYVDLWKKGVTHQTSAIKFEGLSSFNMDNYVRKIKAKDPSYIEPSTKISTAAEKTVAAAYGNKSSGGCYVATAVYGSYDCPEVWTLRRFRDFTLAKSFFGRLFIRTYYAISPTLVKWFGETKWFKNLWKPTLDKMVARLNEKGVENTPYDDIVW